MECRALIVLLLIVAGCSQPLFERHQDLGAKSIELGKTKDITYSTPNVKSDSIFEYKCDGNVYLVMHQDHNWAYFPNGLTDCLSKESNQGFNDTNEDIARILINIGFLKFNRLFENYSHRLRGPEVFEAGLIVGEDFSTVHHPTVGYPIGTVAASTYSFLFTMIESIDGEKDRSKWACKIYEYNDQSCFRTLRPVEVDVEDHKLRFYTLKKMWQKGKIKLKPYGQD